MSTELIIGLALWQFLVAAPTPRNACDEPGLPLEIRQLLANEFQAWSIVELSSLAPKDRSIWVRTKGHAVCPGFTAARFACGSERSYAVALTQRREGKTYSALVLAERSESRYALRVLSPPQEASFPLVVTTVPPGSYRDADSSKQVLTRCEGVLYEQLEAGSLLFYWENGRYLSVQPSI